MKKKESDFDRFIKNDDQVKLKEWIGSINTKTCLNCGKRLRPAFDPVTGKISKYLWRCDCMPSNLTLSIG